MQKKYTTNEQLAKVIDAFLVYCKDEGKHVTMNLFCIFADISKETLSKYSKEFQFVDSIKRLKTICESYSEQLLYENRNPAGIIFSLKNNFHWKDKQEIDTTISVSEELRELFSVKTI